MTPRNQVLVGDALARLRELADSSVECVVTSPPFYLLRNYGVGGQIGLEENGVEEWVERLRSVMAEIHRVLVPTGSVWLDLGDSYAHNAKAGVPTKSLVLGPARLAVALADDGWIVRNQVIWAKTNPMPESVGDRLSTTYDVVLHLVKQRRYFYDLDAIRIPHRSDHGRPDTSADTKRPDWAGPHAGSNAGLKRFRPDGVPGHWLGKNPGDVWQLPKAHYRGAHFATFPERLVERPIKASCPLKVCTFCAAPWRRERGKTFVLGTRRPAGPATGDHHVRRYPSNWRVLHQPGPLVVGCSCDAASRPGLVLDPFFGTGTVGVVAERLGRDWLGIELNPDYVDLAWGRLGRPHPMAGEQAA